MLVAGSPLFAPAPPSPAAALTNVLFGQIAGIESFPLADNETMEAIITYHMRSIRRMTWLRNAKLVPIVENQYGHVMASLIANCFRPFQPVDIFYEHGKPTSIQGHATNKKNRIGVGQNAESLVRLTANFTHVLRFSNLRFHAKLVSIAKHAIELKQLLIKERETTKVRQESVRRETQAYIQKKHKQLVGGGMSEERKRGIKHEFAVQTRNFKKEIALPKNPAFQAVRTKLTGKAQGGKDDMLLSAMMCAYWAQEYVLNPGAH